MLGQGSFEVHENLCLFYTLGSYIVKSYATRHGKGHTAGLSTRSARPDPVIGASELEDNEHGVSKNRASETIPVSDGPQDGSSAVIIETE